MDRLDVWNGQRPLSQRVVVARRRLHLEGMCATLATENIRSPTDWCIEESNHTVVVHLAGHLTRMESVFSKGPSTDALPAIGDIWAIPAGCRYAALAQGEEASFVEFTLPAGIAGQGELSARVGHRDIFLHQAVVKLYELAKRDDDLAEMGRGSLLQVLRFHLLDAYLPAAANTSTTNAPSRQFSKRERKVLDENLRDSIESSRTISDLSSLFHISETSSCVYSKQVLEPHLGNTY